MRASGCARGASCRLVLQELASFVELLSLVSLEDIVAKKSYCTSDVIDSRIIICLCFSDYCIVTIILELSTTN